MSLPETLIHIAAIWRLRPPPRRSFLQERLAAIRYIGRVFAQAADHPALTGLYAATQFAHILSTGEDDLWSTASALTARHWKVLHERFAAVGNLGLVLQQAVGLATLAWLHIAAELLQVLPARRDESPRAGPLLRTGSHLLDATEFRVWLIGLRLGRLHVRTWVNLVRQAVKGRRCRER
jgi:hypothetical protein